MTSSIAPKHSYTKQWPQSLHRQQSWLIVFILFCNGCLLPQYENHTVGEFGQIVVRRGDPAVNGFVVGATHGMTESDAIEYAGAVSDAIRATLVVAYGFKANRVAVAQPQIHDALAFWSPSDSKHRASVYREFKKILRSVTAGPLKFYVQFQIAGPFSSSKTIEVASSGFSFEQIRVLKDAYVAIANELLKDPMRPRIKIAISPLEPISWDAFGIRNHGALMLAQRGLVVRLPKILTQPSVSSVYREIMKRWVREASVIDRNPSVVSPRIKVKETPYGVIEWIPSRTPSRGIVIGAPHGSFDWFTGDMVEELSYRTALASVVTRGFTSTECDGWRIDVNRPTELRTPTDTIERTTERAAKVYQEFKKAVLAAAGGPLNLYFDVHQNSSEDDIMVATLGLTREQAQIIKADFRKIRDRVIPAGSPVTRVNLLIEPLDQVTIGAWAAKDHGILRLAKTSLHFEMPARRIFQRAADRRAYTKILAALIDSITMRSEVPAEPQRVNLIDHQTSGALR